MSRHITLLGAGLTGPLLAIYLAKRGFTVDLYERRPDMRVRDIGGGRSINLALSTRGLTALEGAGIGQAVLDDAIAMPGRMIHDAEGNLSFQPYGTEGQAINSISRAGLNILLMNMAERQPGVTIHFSARCSHVDLESRSVTVVDDETGAERSVEVDLLIAADGANSSLRAAMEAMPGFEARTEWLDHAYKELEIPPGPNGEFLMEEHALHIWPRHDFMMIALPNPGGNFTCTLFAPYEGPGGFDALASDSDVLEYFSTNFADALPLMPTLLEAWHANPTSRLGTVFCSPWYVGDWAFLIGDAAHAIVPFYGQGMNCCFEDCLVLDGLLDGHDGDWGETMRKFYELRKPNADAIARLAVANFLEMRSKVVDPHFLRKKKIEATLHALFPERWIPLYTMVTFTTLPYAEALRRAAAQDALLDAIGLDRIEEALGSGADAVAELIGDRWAN